jgi:pimeloyl-ACP methyl ester carboxylesterase
MKYPLRAWFKGEVMAEFFPPYLGNESKTSNKVIIFCSGAPSAPDYKRVLEYWSKKGYWVFNPRYRGTWESRGVFMESEPTKDLLDIIDELDKPIMDEWNQVEYNCKPEKVFVIGSSFGGPAAVFASRDKRVNKVVLRSPVIDWRSPSEDEPLEHWPQVIERSFGEAYRTTPEIWQKLQTGEFYNPMLHIDEFDGSKIMIIHAEDDTDTRAKEVWEFADKTGCKLYMLKKGGHTPVSLTSWRWARRIGNFFYA